MIILDPTCGFRNKRSGLNNTVSWDTLINGNESGWPWQVSIRKIDPNEKYVHICGGTLVSNTTVISAAHCLQYSTQPSDYVVVLGSLTTDSSTSGEKIINVASLIIPAENNWRKSKFPQDILIITLAEPVNYTLNISPACINTDKELNSNSMCFVTGWGKNASTSLSKASATLKGFRKFTILNGNKGSSK